MADEIVRVIMAVIIITVMRLWSKDEGYKDIIYGSWVTGVMIILMRITSWFIAHLQWVSK